MEGAETTEESPWPAKKARSSGDSDDKAKKRAARLAREAAAESGKSADSAETAKPEEPEPSKIIEPVGPEEDGSDSFAKAKASVKADEPAEAAAEDNSSAPDYNSMDMKALVKLKWKLKDELKIVEKRMKELKSGVPAGSSDTDAPAGDRVNPPPGTPDCIKPCWPAFTKCEKKMPDQKTAMCKCWHELNGKCNTCESSVRKQQASTCNMMGCSKDECKAKAKKGVDKADKADKTDKTDKTDKKGKVKKRKKEEGAKEDEDSAYAGTAEDSPQPKKRNKKPSSMTTAPFSVTDADLLELDASKMKMKPLRRALKERGVQCQGCTEKPEFVAEMRAAQALIQEGKQTWRTDAAREKDAVAREKGGKRGEAEDPYGLRDELDVGDTDSDANIDELLAKMKGQGVNFDYFDKSNMEDFGAGGDGYGVGSGGGYGGGGGGGKKGGKKGKGKKGGGDKEKEDEPIEETAEEKKKRWLEEERAKRKAAEANDPEREARRQKNQEEARRMKAERESARLAAEAEDAEDDVDEVIEL
jgi:hypothetical protein